MRSRSLRLEQEFAEFDGDTLVERPEASRKQYSRGRSARTPCRRSSRSAGNTVPLGISARRGRRWSW